MLLKKKFGFSLMEFIVVILLISIISKISYPIYRDYLLKARLSELLFKIQHSKFTIEQYYLENLDLPDHDYESIICNTLTYHYLKECSWNGSSINLILDSSLTVQKITPEIIITANVDDYLRWQCDSNNFDSENINNFVCK